jgi:hypothetical protein
MKPVVARLFREARQNAGDARADAARAGVMTVPTSNVRGRIFMSYRREETAYPAGWLFDRLARQFGRQQVFKDVDSIEPGDDFVEVITTAVESCDVLLALIGGRWLTIAGQDGRRRLDDPGDFVRLEIEAALARQVRVIPVLVDGARMPRAEELPPSLAKLTAGRRLSSAQSGSMLIPSGCSGYYSGSSLRRKNKPAGKRIAWRRMCPGRIVSGGRSKVRRGPLRRTGSPSWA